jgi:hypothetical protein
MSPAKKKSASNPTVELQDKLIKAISAIERKGAANQGLISCRTQSAKAC